MSDPNLLQLLTEARETIQSLHEELAETNRGMVALTVELERAREQHQALFENAVEGIFQITPEGRYLAANPALARLYGYDSPEDLIRSVTDITGHLYVETGRRAEFLRLMREQGCVRGFESEIHRKDGRRAWISESVHAIRDPQEAVQYYEGFVEDITERKRAEGKLALYKEIITYSNDAIAIIDTQGNYLEQNAAHRSLIGYSDDELQGQTPAIHLGEETFSVIAGELARSGIYHGEGTSKTKDGRKLDLDLAAFTLRNAQGIPVCHVGIKRDITERKALDEQLRQAQKMEAVGKLAGGIAHEFNNLLTVITGYSELLLQSAGADGRFREGLAYIKTAGNRAAVLTSQLLAVSRKQLLQPTVLNLNHLVTAVEPMLRQLLGESIELVLRLDPGLGTVKIDPGKLDQVIINLALNARDAMPQGGGRLTIETANVVLGETHSPRLSPIRHGPHVLLTVSDTGVGMNAETQRRIFEPFFTTKEVGKGTGLGLAMVQGIVTQSAGDIVVYSEPGHGTTVKIYLPRVATPMAASGAAAIETP